MSNIRYRSLFGTYTVKVGDNYYYVSLSPFCKPYVTLRSTPKLFAKYWDDPDFW